MESGMTLLNSETPSSESNPGAGPVALNTENTESGRHGERAGIGTDSTLSFCN